MVTMEIAREWRESGYPCSDSMLYISGIKMNYYRNHGTHAGSGDINTGRKILFKPRETDF